MPTKDRSINDDLTLCMILPPFHNVKLCNVAYIYLDVNKSKHMYIYMYVDNARKYYTVK